jgi:hypothetical protein
MPDRNHSNIMASLQAGRPFMPVDEGEGSVSEPAGNTIPAVRAIPDSLQGQSPEEQPEILPGSPADSLPINSTEIDVPAAQESIWDRIDSRNREIEATKTETPVITRKAPPPAAKAIVPEYKPGQSDGEDIFFLAPGRDIIFAREHIFPGMTATAKEPEANTIVFVETGIPVDRNMSVAYRTYLEAKASNNNNDQVQYSTSWIPGMVILSLLLLAWIKLAYVQFLTPVLISTFNYKEALKLYISKNAPAQNAFVILHLIFAVNGGLFLLLIAGHFNFNMPDIPPSLLFLIASAFIVLLFGLKNAVLRITGFLFDSPKFFAEYSHNISLFNKILGVMLMPLIVGLLYADAVIHNMLIYTGLTMIVAFYLLQLVRGLEIISRKGFSVFYLILYLCTFEIIPIFILYRLFNTFFFN